MLAKGTGRGPVGFVHEGRHQIDRVERRLVDAVAVRNVNTPEDLGRVVSDRGSVPDSTAATGEKDEFPE